MRLGNPVVNRAGNPKVNARRRSGRIGGTGQAHDQQRTGLSLSGERLRRCVRRDGGERLRRLWALPTCRGYAPAGAMRLRRVRLAPTYRLPTYRDTKKPRRVPGLVCALCVRLQDGEAILR